jgi:insulysin
MLAAKPPQKKISASAAKAFEASVRELEPGLDQAVYDSVPSEEGGTPMAQWGQYWAKVLGQKPIATTLMKALPELLQKYPVEEEADVPAPLGVEFIYDPKAFRAGLQVAPHPGPLAHWDDKPLSKL